MNAHNEGRKVVADDRIEPERRMTRPDRLLQTQNGEKRRAGVEGVWQAGMPGMSRPPVQVCMLFAGAVVGRRQAFVVAQQLVCARRSPCNSVRRLRLPTTHVREGVLPAVRRRYQRGRPS